MDSCKSLTIVLLRCCISLNCNADEIIDVKMKSPVRRFGTHFLIRCVIQLWSLNVLGATWKRISLLDIRDMTALEVLHNRATQTNITIYLYTYLLTY